MHGEEKEAMQPLVHILSYRTQWYVALHTSSEVHAE